MNGWTVIYKKEFLERDNLNLFEFTFRNQNILISRCESKWFNDSIFYDDTDFTVLIDGVILNLSELLADHKCNSLKQLADELLHKEGKIGRASCRERI